MSEFPEERGVIIGEDGESWAVPVLALVRGLVRPVATLTLIGASIWFAAEGKIDPSVISTSTVAAFAFWFGGR